MVATQLIKVFSPITSQQEYDSRFLEVIAVACAVGVAASMTFSASFIAIFSPRNYTFSLFFARIVHKKESENPSSSFLLVLVVCFLALSLCKCIYISRTRSNAHIYMHAHTRTFLPVQHLLRSSVVFFTRWK